MFHGHLSEPMATSDASREKLGLLMGGAHWTEGSGACSWCLKSAPSGRTRSRWFRR
jgi:hypothetical protein